MAGRQSYRQTLERDLGALIDGLELPEVRKHALRSRWLDQVLWMEGRTARASFWHSILRVTALVGGILIPVLAGLSIEGSLANIPHYSIVVLGLVVAISTGLEELFQFGERWRHYRQTVETLKIEGWRFFQLSDPYRRYGDHAQAYPLFADRVEDVLRQDVRLYITEMAQAREEAAEREAGPAERARG